MHRSSTSLQTTRHPRIAIDYIDHILIWINCNKTTRIAGCARPTAATAGDDQRLIRGEQKGGSAAAAASVLILVGKQSLPSLANDDEQHLACLEASSAVHNAAQAATNCMAALQ